MSARVYQQSGIKVEKEKSSVEAHTRGHHATMFPLWFLTWRKDERVAYAVVNGESGKVVSDLPVDMKAFSSGCAAMAVVIFLLLEIFVQPTPVLTSLVSILAAAMMAASIRSSTRRIFEKETHVYDKGWSGSKEPVITEADQNAKKVKKVKKFLDIEGYPLMAFAIIAVTAIVQLADIKSVTGVIGVAALFYVLLTVIKILGWQKSLPQKQPLLAIFPVLAAVALNAAIVIISPVNDFWYYLGDAACILILTVSSVFMLQVYNIGTTRPLPHLFDREEVQ